VLCTLGLVCHGCCVFILECKLLARLLTSRLALYVVVFHIYASADASLCTRWLACRLLVLFVCLRLLQFFVVFVSVRCVLCGVIFWMFEGCSWFVCVGGGGKVPFFCVGSVSLFGRLLWC